MKVKGCIHLLLIFLIFQFRTSAQSGRSYKELYRQAERLYYSSSSTDRTDSIALSTYLEVISRHDNRPDSLLMDAHFKAGIYLQTAGKFAAAIPYFRKTLQIFEKAGGLEDSLQFLPNLFLGNSYYTGDQLDSAFFYFKKAEVIAAEYSHIAGLERLYNTLGVIYFESGDYHQSTIYFDKALATLRDQNSGNAFLEVNYQSNFASSMRKLGQREKAMQIYQGLLKFHINEDEILHNIGSMYLEQGRDSLAIQYLRKVSYNNAAKANDLALAWFHLGNNTEAKSQLRKAEVLSKRKNGELKSVQLGLSHKLLGDIMLHEGNYDSSLIYYQSALNQLIFSFNSTNYREDPAEFSGQYYVMELFETLVAKAHAFNMRYEAKHSVADLRSCVHAHQSAYAFADYISLTYESEEARLMMGNRKHISHNEPIDACVKLYALTKDPLWVETAFDFDEKNKATVLVTQLQENRLKINTGLPLKLIGEEKSLKQLISSMVLKVRTMTDTMALAETQGKIRDLQIALGRLREKFDNYPEYKKHRFVDNTVSLRNFQKLIPLSTAVISYHFGEHYLLRFMISRDTLKMETIVIEDSLAAQLKELNRKVQLLEDNDSRFINKESARLYGILFSGLQVEMKLFERVMIIPDDELGLIPFEMLKDGDGKLLVDDHEISYNYSCTIIKEAGENRKNNYYPALSFAPFVTRDEGNSGFAELGGSGEEISAIPGERLVGKLATKNEFLRSASRFGILHLATHAVANDLDPTASYIVFYPGRSGADSSYRLYASEIVNLSLPATNLVVLSACETGAGELVRGEGVMSLGRAFSYAGCPATITSLWRAEDFSTSYICRAFHGYLQDGYLVQEALQKAIRKYLRDDAIPNQRKGPGYWAHLRLVAGFEKNKTANHLSVYFLVGGILASLLIILVSRRGSGPSRVARN